LAVVSAKTMQKDVWWAHRWGIITTISIPGVTKIYDATKHKLICA
jgi:hypothetical protein